MWHTLLIVNCNRVQDLQKLHRIYLFIFKKIVKSIYYFFSYHSGSLYDYMLANKVKISYALANYELSPPNSEEVERFNQLISWSYQVSIFRLVEGLYIGELRKIVSLII